MLTTPTPLVKSRIRLPSTSVTQTPEALAAATGDVFVLFMRYRSSPATIFFAFGPGIGVTIRTPRRGVASSRGTAGGTDAFALVAGMVARRTRPRPKGLAAVAPESRRWTIRL